MATPRLEFRVLGPLAVRVDGVSVPLGGPKQRALLAMLLLSANRVVSRERLSAELFADRSVDSADHALRNHVSRLRKVLSPVATDDPRLVARPPGYLLRVEPDELDLETFERLVAKGRESLAAGDPTAAAESLRAAEALWSGRPLADLAFETITRVEVERLEELRLAAVEARIEAELALGRQHALVPELEELAGEHPFRERFRAQLMLALYRSGRQADGLEVYRCTRELLHGELGLEPGIELQQLEHAILVQDAKLDLSANGSGGDARPLRDICPYKGLAPFEVFDAEFFFGRERLVDELVARLGEASLLAIVGPSGSGKSSLLRAGLLPALERESVLVRPGERPMETLADVHVRLDSGERLVLAVDQFEELLGASVAEDERRAFIDAIVEGAWDPDRRLLVVIALRADYLGRLAGYVELADLVGPNHLLLGPMSQGELRRAIEGPAERTGLDVEQPLVDTLVEEVAGEPGALPLLSTALLDLWHERRGASLTLAAYERTGGVRGAVGRHAEAAFRSLEEEQQQIARRILLRMVGGGDGEPLTRRRVTRAELDADGIGEVAAVLAVLVERRLLVADEATVELVHECLLEHWRRLADWLEEDVQGRLLHRHLTQAAAEWEASGHDPSTLYRGARLAGALDWTREHDPELNQLERRFLDESRAASLREAGRQRRANRRLRALLVAALALLALAIGAAALALQKRDQAQREATAAVAERLGAQALVDPSLDQALLLAREGVNLDDSEAARSNLLAALLRSPAAIGVVREGSARLLDEALSPDGRTLAIRGDDGNVAFFDARTLRRVRTALTGTKELASFAAVLGPLHALAFSPDGRTLAVGGTTGGGPVQAATVTLVGSQTLVSRSSTTSGNILADVAFAPDGRAFATGEAATGMTSRPEVIVVRDARTGLPRAQTGPIPGARLAGYTPDGRFLVVAAARRSLLLDAHTLRLVRAFAVSGAGAVSSADDEAAFGHDDGSVTLLDLSTGAQSTLLGQASAGIEAVSFSRDGGRLAATAEDGTVSVWSVHEGALQETLNGHSAAALSAVFSPDGRTLYTASSDGSAIAWDLTGARRLGQAFQFAPPGGSGSTGSAVSWNGALFALSPGPDRVTLWRADSRTPVGPALRGPVGEVEQIAFSRDGKLIAAVGSRRAVVWDTATRKIVRTLPVGRLGGSAVAFSPDGLVLAIGRLDSVNALYDLRTGSQTGTFMGESSTTDLDFSPDGRVLAAASDVGTVTIWDVTHQNKVSLLGGAPYVSAVRFSPDGKLIAVGNSSGTVVFWKLDESRRFSVPGQTVWAARPVGPPLVGGGGALSSLAFDPQGRTLVTLSEDGSLRLWDVATRKLIGAPLPGSNTGGSVHFFPDGKDVLGAFPTGTAIVWDVDPAAWKTRACRIARRNLTRAEWAAFLGGRRYGTACRLANRSSP